MLLDRLRPGEVVAALGSISLLVLLFLDWVQPEVSVIREPGADVPAPLEGQAGAAVDGYLARTSESGWTGLGIPVVVLLVLLALAGLVLAGLTVSRMPVALPVAAEVVTSFLGIVVSLVLLLRLTLGQPDLDLGFRDQDVAILAPAWLGLASCALIGGGAWWAMSDERTTAPYSVVPDVPVRPAPPDGGDARGPSLPTS